MEFQCSGPCFSFLSCVFISHRIVLSMLSSNMVLLTLASYSWRMCREFSTLNHTDYFYCYKNNAELRARLLDPFHRPLPSCQFMLWAAVPPLDQWSTLISWKELSQGLPLFPTYILFSFFFFFSRHIIFRMFYHLFGQLHQWCAAIRHLIELLIKKFKSLSQHFQKII